MATPPDVIIILHQGVFCHCLFLMDLFIGRRGFFCPAATETARERAKCFIGTFEKLFSLKSAEKYRKTAIFSIANFAYIGYTFPWNPVSSIGSLDLSPRKAPALRET
jgi:hypothetical protein